MKKLRTPLQVVRCLGEERVCKLVDANKKQVWHWHSRARKFPAYTYVVLQYALKARRASAPDRLWAMKGLNKIVAKKAKKSAA
jgi:hypothetical protein